MSVLAAIAAGLTVAAPAVLVLAGVFGPLAAKLVDAHVSEKDAAKVRAVVDDVYTVASGLAVIVPGNLDDEYVAALKKVDDAFKAIHGRPLTAGEKAAAGVQILANHLDPTLPSLSPPAPGNTLPASADRAFSSAVAAGRASIGPQP